MISHEEFLQTELEMGINGDNPNFINLANATVNQLSISYHSVLDYGAGIGVYSDAFHRSGKETYTFELWKPHREYMKMKFPHLNIVKEPITTDLLCWIEVAEHMKDEEIDLLFKKIKPKYILFSSTPHKTDNDIAWGHINLKDHQGWIDTMQKHNFTFIQNLSYPTPWAKLFQCV